MKSKDKIENRIGKVIVLDEYINLFYKIVYGYKCLVRSY